MAEETRDGGNGGAGSAREPGKELATAGAKPGTPGQPQQGVPDELLRFLEAVGPLLTKFGESLGAGLAAQARSEEVSEVEDTKRCRIEAGLVHRVLYVFGAIAFGVLGLALTALLTDNVQAMKDLLLALACVVAGAGAPGIIKKVVDRRG